MLDCPNCGESTYDGASCSACRFVVRGKKLPAPHDPSHLGCWFGERGQRCAELGTLSQGTKGEGPWYCTQHFPPFAGRRYGIKPTLPPKGFDSLKVVLEKKFPALTLYDRQPGEEG